MKFSIFLVAIVGALLAADTPQAGTSRCKLSEELCLSRCALENRQCRDDCIHGLLACRQKIASVWADKVKAHLVNPNGSSSGVLRKRGEESFWPFVTQWYRAKTDPKVRAYDEFVSRIERVYCQDARLLLPRVDDSFEMGLDRVESFRRFPHDHD